MIRILLIIAGLFAVAVGFEWLKDRPGELTLSVGGVDYSVGLAPAASGLLILAVLSVIVYLAIRIVWTAPGKAVFAWHGRKTERGRQAISQGLLAIAAGDLRGAELAAREAAKRAPAAPLTALLKAQTAQLRGDRDGARDTFTAMLDRPETRIAGLHGLFVEAERQGALEAAHHYAKTARETRSDTAWAARALLRFQAGAGNWDEALATLTSAANSRSIDKKTARYHRAVLLTAKAMAGEDADTANAKQAALEAHQLVPELVPAAIVAGRILARLGEIKRAAKVLETTWKGNPHPELADAYAHVRSGDSALDRMARMDRLFELKPHHDEGRMALAEMAMEAREWKTARDALTPIITTRPTRNALLLMAELDEAEHGDRGRVREWLDRAVRAPRDPVWTADGAVLDEWAPVSPVTGRLGTVEWKVPVEDGDASLAIDMDDEAFRPREPLPAVTAAAAVSTLSDEGPTDDGEIIDVEPAEQPDKAPEAIIIDAEPVETKPPEAAKAEKAKKAEVAAKTEKTEVAAEPVTLTEQAIGKEPAAAHTGPAEQPSQDRATADESRPETGGETADSVTGKAAGKLAAADAIAPEAMPAKAAAPEGEEKPAEPAVETAPKAEPKATLPVEPANDDLIIDADAPEADAAEPDDGPIVPPVPDDPGIDEADEPEPRRFKLF